MLSTNNVTANQAENYYQKDDYYSHGLGDVDRASNWYGKGAEALGLRGEINQEDFKQLLAGKDPSGKNLHAKTVDPDKHRAGTDCTFSAPKSVSIAGLVQQDSRVIAAHDKAVETALEVMQDRYAQARVWDGERKQQERIDTGNLVVACYRHETSRNQDPQLHTHAVVINATQLEDGTWRALSNEEVVNHKKLLGEIYQNELAYQLREIGYKTESRENGQFEIIGYDQDLRNSFSSRRQEIEKFVQESGKGNSTKLYEYAALKTRSVKEVLPREELLAGWERMLKNENLALPELPKYQKQSIEKSGERAAETAAVNALAHASERESVFRLGKVEQFALENHLGQQSWQQLQSALENSNQLIRVDRGEKYTTQQAINREAHTIELMHEEQGKTTAIATSAEVEGVAPENLTEGQRQALELSATTTDRVIAWQGVAGAGKTYALHLYQQLAANKGYIVKGYAPSAEAANTLGQEAGITSDTVASLLVSKPDPRNPPQPDKEIWVVDEAGLLSAKDAHDLLQKAADQKARVILVGDTRQLSAVEAGNPFKSLQQAGMNTAKLDQSLRQRKQELKEAVSSFAKGEVSESFTHLDAADSIRTVSDQEDRVRTIAQDYLSLPQEDRQKTLLIANTNAERLALTQEIRLGLQTEGVLGADAYTATTLRAKDLTTAQANYAGNYATGNVIIPSQDYKKLGLTKGEQYEVTGNAENIIIVKSNSGEKLTFDPSKTNKINAYEQTQIPIAIGDQLRWTKNDREQGRRNGQTFTVQDIQDNEATIKYDDGRIETANLKQRQFADYAIVGTTYSSQGKTADRVLVALDKSTGKEAFYVAISRARIDLQIYTTDRDELQQLAARSKARENVGDYVDLYTYQGKPDATHQSRERSQGIAADFDAAASTADDSTNRGQGAGIGTTNSISAPLRTDDQIRRVTGAINRSLDCLSGADPITRADAEGVAERVTEFIERREIRRNGPEIAAALGSIAGNIDQLKQVSQQLASHSRESEYERLAQQQQTRRTEKANRQRSQPEPELEL